MSRRDCRATLFCARWTSWKLMARTAKRRGIQITRVRRRNPFSELFSIFEKPFLFLHSLLPARNEKREEEKKDGNGKYNTVHSFNENSSFLVFHGLKFTGIPSSICSFTSFSFELIFFPKSLLDPTQTNTTRATKMMYSTSPWPDSFFFFIRSPFFL